MMKVRQIYDDGNLVLLRDHLGQWWKIVHDCVLCGQCCMDVPPNWQWYDADKGGCLYLAEENDQGEHRCLLGKIGRPFRCCGNSPFSTVEYCSVEFEKITEDEAVELLLEAA